MPKKSHGGNGLLSLHAGIMPIHFISRYMALLASPARFGVVYVKGERREQCRDAALSEYYNMTRQRREWAGAAVPPPR